MSEIPAVDPDAELIRRGAKNVLRALISRAEGGVPDLSKCTAKRTLCPDGTLLEVVKLDGSSKLLDRGKLQEWLISQPVIELKK
jgi:hypothetical protein